MACPHRFDKVKNMLDDQTYVDTLHKKSSGQVPCNKKRCMGSFMSQQSQRALGTFRTMEELLSHAKDFIEQFYDSIDQKNTPAHFKRISEIQDQVEKSGSYDLTRAELTFGAKLAWRNAPRCIGRIQWSKLQVFDARKIETPRGMFEALCHHIKYGTNNGQIRSAITIFPQRKMGRSDFRVWNQQLIGYAGYQMDNSEVIGDPANVEFTDQCIKMGWKPKYGKFDLLPLVLSAAGFDPEWFDIPQELVLEISIKHPNYPWFSELGLKWYALPAVSGMVFDCGGLEFTACPFNGWYMSTEIGCRNFCDANRYNMLEPIALKMGLQRNAASLWKDKALLESNLAVLHSFEAASVTITNHHDASESFITHFENEQSLRGGCPGDWVWLVPPMSQSALKVFHQELLLYKLKPSFEYQDNKPWKTHLWKNYDKPKTLNRTKRKIGFSELARAVKFSASLMSKALANRIRCTILFASETGKSQLFAERLQETFKMTFDAKVFCMENYDVSFLEQESLVLVISSTWGNGEPPENGKSVANSLFDLKKKYDLMNGVTDTLSLATTIKMCTINDQTASLAAVNKQKNSLAMVTGPLCNLRFAVFGLGSTAYPNFAAFSKYIDKVLYDLGAERLLAITTGDELFGQEQSYRIWSDGVFRASCDVFCVGENINTNEATGSENDDHSWSNKVRIVPVQKCQEPDICEVLSKIHGKKILPCSLNARTQLQAQDSESQTILVQLNTHNASDLNYGPGDHVGIFPVNCPDFVEAILERLDATQGPSRDQVICTEVFTELGPNETWTKHEKLPICTLRMAFSYFLDITTPPSQKILQMFATQASCDTDKKRLELLAMDSVAYEKWRTNLSPNILQVLEQFSSLKVPPSLLLTQLPYMQQRYYSISSSPVMHIGELHATIAVVKFRTQEGAGPVHGVCSSWLNRCALGTVVPCFIKTAPNFHLPENPSLPVIMIGRGIGIAPFRSFWQERLQEIDLKTISSKTKHCFGQMILYFGCKTVKENFYGKELAEMKESGVLSNYHVAYSKEPDLPKCYVQDIILQNAASIYEMIDNGAHVYIAGDMSMAHIVTRTLEVALCEHGGMYSKAAADRVTELRDVNRFHEDIFGVKIRQSGEMNSKDQKNLN
ncbi:unnamed protein product [Lymnaea stagnalis]|uniref:Nitric oxide synthase n=1 Tax=Lymnaea stagnalis TaxID=6523 RepID=A0AAV2HTR1_LYMST